MWDDAYLNPLDSKIDREEVDPNTEAYMAGAQADYELCVHFAKIFKGKSGTQVRNFFKKVSDSPTWCNSFGSRDAAMDFGFAREGQNALIRDIERRIEIGNNCKNVEEYLDHVAMKGKQDGV